MDARSASASLFRLIDTISSVMLEVAGALPPPTAPELGCISTGATSNTSDQAMP